MKLFGKTGIIFLLYNNVFCKYEKKSMNNIFENKLSDVEKKRYSRQMQLHGWGSETQLKLKNARVLVVGAGALGCAVLQNLALAGIGTLGIVDDDFISISNLQRQVLFTQEDIGVLKAENAKQKIKKLNSFVKVELFNERIVEGNVLTILNDFDIIVDGSDNFSTKYLLNDACVILDKPLVFGSIEAFEGQVSVFNFMNGPTYRCLFPFFNFSANSNDCNSIGVTTSLPLFIGNIQANEVVKIISGIGDVLSGKFLLANLLNNSFQLLHIQKNIENNNKNNLKKKYNFFSEEKSNVIPVSLLELKTDSQKFWLLDVRSEYEHSKYNLGGKNIPIYDIDFLMNEIPYGNNILAYCNEGQSAKQAALLISRKKNVTVYYLDSPLTDLITA